MGKSADTTERAALILGAHGWTNNAALIADVHRLGYMTDADRVLDPTYGKGNWWKAYRPPLLVEHDLYTLDGVDFRALPEPDASFDVVAFDPPYVGVGGVTTSTVPGFQQAYGIDQPSKRPEDVLALMVAGTKEMYRVLRPGGVLLLKCMNYVMGGKYRTVAYDALGAAEAIGFGLIDEMIHLRSPGPQPQRDYQQHARRNYSHLFVLRRDGVPMPGGLA